MFSLVCNTEALRSDERRKKKIKWDNRIRGGGQQSRPKIIGPSPGAWWKAIYSIIAIPNEANKQSMNKTALDSTWYLRWRRVFNRQWISCVAGLPGRVLWASPYFHSQWNTNVLVDYRFLRFGESKPSQNRKNIARWSSVIFRIVGSWLERGRRSGSFKDTYRSVNNWK